MIVFFGVLGCVTWGLGDKERVGDDETALM